MSTTTKILLGLAAGVVVFELVEHLVFPLIWYLIAGRRKPKNPLVGQRARVTAWQKNKGQVFVRGEIWQATGREEISPGQAVIIKAVNGLTLEVEPTNSQGHKP